jgi:hypothetical protein
MPLRVLLLVGAVLVAACGAPPGSSDPPPGDAAGPRPDAAAAPDATADLFTVQYADPDHGPFRGGTEVQLRGNGFSEDVEVWIGGRQALDVEYVDSRRLTVITPPGEPGPADLEVRRPGGEVAVDDGGFTFDAVAIDPPGGSTAGSTFVTITGFGTDFAPGTVAFLDGLPLTGVTVVGPDRLTGFTPPGSIGDADLLVSTATTVVEVDRGYTYYTTGDPFSGGLSGGPADGVLNVVVLDNRTKLAVPGAFVVVGDPATSAHQGRTDALGQITFSGDDLQGPLDVTATAEGFEVGSFHCFDARNVTFYVRAPPPPAPPEGTPGSVGTADGTIRGSVQFGTATELGSPFWSLVPEPRTPTEFKRIWVTTSSPSIFSSPRRPVAPIDYDPDAGAVSWEFEVASRPGAYAVVALAGLYDPALDPEGNGVSGFQPFALGVTRGVLVGPGEEVRDVDVTIDIPLDAAALVELDEQPPLDSPGWPGPYEYLLRAWVELGSDGAIAFGRHGLPIVAGEPPPGETRFPTGADDVLLTAAPPRYSTLGDASYTFQAGAWTNGSNPMSVRILRGVPSLGALTIDRWLGVPRQVDPPRGGTGTGRRVEFTPEGSPRAPTFHMHLLSRQDGAPVWRGVTCGAQRAVELVDLSPAGFAWPPTDEPLVWTIWSITTTTDDYAQWSYRWLGAAYWSAYAADAAMATFPSPPSPEPPSP